MRAKGAALLALACLLSACARDEAPVDTPWFVEEAAVRGLNFQHRSGFGGSLYLPEIVGGGAALVDVDGDGDLDAYLVQSGWNLAEGAAPDSPANQLFLNRGDGFFDPATDIGDGADRGYGMGVAVGDYDQDGDMDLYVTNLGPNALLRNDGAGHFENVAASAGVNDPGWSTAAVFFDLDNDGDQDLYVVNYVNWSVAIEKPCSSRGSPTYCAPTAYNAPAMDRLYRNEGDGTFVDITVLAGINRSFGNGLGAVAADFNNDGFIDIFVANDRTVDQLWINKQGQRLEDEAAAWGCAVDDHGIAKAGMGVAAPDIDNDGDPDLLVVNFENETDSFYRNEGHYFADMTARLGIAAISRRHTRFGVVLADFDNDGLLDLFEANGKVDGNPARTPDAFAEPNTLYQGRRDGDSTLTFATVTPAGGVDPPLNYTSRGLALGDVNRDGALDLLLVNRDGPAQLLINRRSRGQSVRFRVVDAAGHGVPGARVSALVGGERHYRSVQVGGSYLAAHDPEVYLGIGQQQTVTAVEVRWPDGASEVFGDYPAGKSHVLRRGEGRTR